MSLGLILIIVLIVLLLGAWPGGPLPISNNWGYGPSGLLVTVLIIVLVLVLLGRL